MAAKNTKMPPATGNPRVPHSGKFVGVSTKENFRRPIPKTYSYRYEVIGDAGPRRRPARARRRRRSS